MTTLQDAAAKGPEPTRSNRFVEIVNTLAFYILGAVAIVILFAIFVAGARGEAVFTSTAYAEGNHNCANCGSPRQFRDNLSGTYTGNPGGFYQGQRSSTTLSTLSSIAVSIGNAIGRWADAIGTFYDNNIRYHYQDSPNQYGIAASPG